MWTPRLTGLATIGASGWDLGVGRLEIGKQVGVRRELGKGRTGERQSVGSSHRGRVGETLVPKMDRRNELPEFEDGGTVKGVIGQV